MRKDVDMLNGPTVGKILLFALPVAASSILQQLFNAVDVMVVGRFVSSQALAAVGANTTVISLFLNLFIGITLGANAVIAGHIGMRDGERVRIGVSTCASLALWLGVSLLVVGQIVARPLLAAMGTPDDIMEQALLYLRIYFLGVPFIMIFNFGAAILRSRGDTQRPLYILIAAGVVNTLLNLLLVLVFHLGVEGVAIATGVSNMVSATVIVLMLLREDGDFRLDPKNIRLDRTEVRAIMRIGLPAGFQSMLFAISNVFVQSAVNSYGSAAVAGNAAALTYESFGYQIVPAFCSATMTFTSQNYAAGRYDRCRRIFREGMVLSTLTCLVVTMAMVAFRDPLLRLFSTDPEVIAYGKVRMETALLCLFLCNSYEIASAVMRGYGESLPPALLAVLGTCVLRLVWIYVVSTHFPGFNILILAYPASWIVTGMMVLTAYHITSRKHYRSVEEIPSTNLNN